jgi:hypothetical protein
MSVFVRSVGHEKLIIAGGPRCTKFFSRVFPYINDSALAGIDQNRRVEEIKP